MCDKAAYRPASRRMEKGSGMAATMLYLADRVEAELKKRYGGKK